MWRGTTWAKPIRTGASFVGLGTHRQRMVFYPISHPNSTGLSMIDWIAEVTMATPKAGSRAAGSARSTDSFVDHFEDWIWDWLWNSSPALIRQADSAFENPMIDRDPVPSWVEGPVSLTGDAAHAVFPTGSTEQARPS